LTTNNSQTLLISKTQPVKEPQKTVSGQIVRPESPYEKERQEQDQRRDSEDDSNHGDRDEDNAMQNGASNDLDIEEGESIQRTVHTDEHHDSADQVEIVISGSPTEVAIEVDTPRDIQYFLDVIRCIYQVEMESPIHELFDVFILATTYGVDCAIQKCAKLLRTELSLKSVCTALELPEHLESNEHVKELLDISRKHLVEQFGDLHSALQNPEFLELSQKALLTILQSDNLAPLDSENTVLYAILLWIEHKQERKKYLETLLPFVRFPQLRKYYLLSVPLMIKDCSPETSKYVSKLYNEAMEYKVGGQEWIKDKLPHTNHKNFLPRPQSINSNPFTMTEKFTGVSKWQVDKPHWSNTYFSNGYSIQFYVCKSAQSFGVYLHVFNAFINALDFCLPLSFTIYLLHKNGIYEKNKAVQDNF